jgi:hypothetical protein
MKNIREKGYVKMPVNNEKNQIRNYCYDICANTKYLKKVFTLLGTDGGFATLLPENIKVYSAETQPEVYKLQQEKFPKYNLHKGQAFDVLSREKNFGFIWLDFFSNCTTPRNLLTIGAAWAALKKGGTLVITSNNKRNKTIKNITFSQYCYQLFGTFDEGLRYLNNGNSMSVFTYKKR